MLKKIYALTDNEVIFYIGQSNNLELRLKAHIKISEKLITDKDKKIQDIIKNNRKIGIKILRKCQKKNALKIERMTIENHVKDGHELVNYNFVICKYKFTAKELRILQLLADDNNTYDIANKTGLSDRAIETIRNRMKLKAKVRSIGALIYYAAKQNLVQ